MKVIDIKRYSFFIECFFLSPLQGFYLFCCFTGVTLRSTPAYTLSPLRGLTMWTTLLSHELYAGVNEKGCALAQPFESLALS